MGILLKDILCVMTKENGFAVEPHTVYLEGDRISGIDVEPKGFTLTDTIAGKGKLLMPGLINCHTHAYMSLFRNCADDVAFDEWLFQRIMPLEDVMTSEDAYWGAMLSIVEMLKSGTTCFLDMHMHKNETTRAVDVSGIRAVIGRGLAGGMGEDDGLRRLKEALSEMEDWKHHARMKFVLAPHAVYTCEPEYLQRIANEAERLGCDIHTHLSESRNEVKNCVEKYGRTPVAHMEALGLFARRTVAAHCVYLTEGDFALLQKYGVSVATNPASNMKLGNGFAPVEKLLARGINVCIGTDGAASNNTQNLFREMNLAALIHKGKTESSVCVGADEVLAFATVNAAKALGLSDQIGTIEVGKRADLVVLDIEAEQFTPRTDLIKAISYSTSGSNVYSVIIDGRLVMDKRQLRTIDEEHVFYSVNKIAARLGLLR